MARPSCSALRARAGLRETTTTSQPRSRATRAVRRPIGPAPMTVSASPGSGLARACACTATASGSTSVPALSSTASGSANSIRASTTTRSAYPPGRPVPRPTPLAMAVAHTCSVPARQAAHSPHCANGSTQTRSPAFQPSTPSPSSPMEPENSCARHGAGGKQRRNVTEVQVGAADPAEGDVDGDLPRPGLRRGPLDHPQQPILTDLDRAHGAV